MTCGLSPAIVAIAGAVTSFCRDARGAVRNEAGGGTQGRGIAAEWRLRERQLSERSAQLVAPSSWLTDIASKRFGGRIAVSRIPYCIDLQTYSPAEDAESLARQLGRQSGVFRILMGAENLDDTRKGLGGFLDVYTRRSAELPPHCLTLFGKRSVLQAEANRWVDLGPIGDERLLKLHYAASSLFVMPSIQDNYPNTLIEAASCGLPSIVFESSGCSELVRDGMSGRIVPTGDYESMFERVLELARLSPVEQSAMRVHAREFACESFDEEQHVASHLKVYEELVGASG